MGRHERRQNGATEVQTREGHPPRVNIVTSAYPRVAAVAVGPRTGATRVTQLISKRSPPDRFDTKSSFRVL